MTNLYKIDPTLLAELSEGGKPVVTEVNFIQTEDQTHDVGYLLTHWNEEKTEIISSERYSNDDIAKHGLDQIRLWADQDNQRYCEYGDTWHAMCVKAEVVYVIPSHQGGFVKQIMSSSGICGIESDSPESYIHYMAWEEAREALSSAERLGVVVPADLVQRLSEQRRAGL